MCVCVYLSGVLERLVSSVERQQHHMTTRGLLQSRSSSSSTEEVGEEPPGGAHLSREELQQLVRRAQLWPLMEQLAVLNQLRLSTDLLHLALSPGYPPGETSLISSSRAVLFTTDRRQCFCRDPEAEDNLRRELSRHLRYCLQSTPMNVTQLQPLWFLLSSDRVGTPSLVAFCRFRCRRFDSESLIDFISFLLQPAEELQFVWCELLSEALAALWSSSVTSDPDRWLKWDPLRPACPESPKMLSRAEHMVLTSDEPSPWTRRRFPLAILTLRCVLVVHLRGRRC